MKKLVLSLAAFAAFQLSYGQVSITAADMPVSGDSLRNSIVLPIGANLDLTVTGANSNWDFSDLTPVSQLVDRYKTAAQVNATYALTISPNAYGYLVTDTFDLSAIGQQLPIPISVTDVYTFFSKKNNPSRFVAEAFAAEVTGFPIPAVYSDEDEWYFFPLEFGNGDTSTYKLDVDVLGTANLKMEGGRRTLVDGWGKIKTPHFTTAVDCIRIKSETDETDTVTFSGSSVGFPRKTTEYKWLTPGEHYPALWVTEDNSTGTPTVTSVRFRDHYRNLNPAGIADAKPSIQMLTAYPVPAQNDKVTIEVPQQWRQYIVTVFDRAGKVVSHTNNTASINTAGWAAGEYFARVISGSNTGFVRLSK
jgi:hypothetical protein